jgi:hypothetical protein
MHRAGGELLGDLRGRDERHLDTVDACDGAAVVARATRLDEVVPGAGEERLGIFLQPPRREEGCAELRGARVVFKGAASTAIYTARPTAGTGAALPSRVSSAS